MIEAPNLAHVATVMGDGSPQVSPVWIDHDGDYVLINTAEQRLKTRNVRRDPRVAISIADRENPYPPLMIRGRVVEVIGGEPAWEHFQKLRMKYRGRRDTQLREGHGRLIWKIEADRVFTPEMAPALAEADGLSGRREVHIVELSEHMLGFVQEVFPAIVGTRRRDGTVQMNPAWFEYRDGYFWLNSWRGARWLAHLERDPDVTLALIDPQEMYRYAQVQGRVVETTEEGAAEHLDRLSMRYAGRPYQYARGPQQRVKIQVEPTRITGSADRRPRRSS